MELPRNSSDDALSRKEKRPFLGNRDPIGGAVATNCVVLPAGASVMAPPEVQSTDPAAALQHVGRPRWQSGVPIESMAAGFLRMRLTTAVQQIALPIVVEGFLERQRSCSIHLSTT